ncbi:MAG: hypothetical protein MUF01_14660 [Bryobacterales bacterium]|nr:hypothetical protein [Bryobacterales bacterium]
MYLTEFLQGPEADPCACQKQHRSNGQGGQNFSAPMSIGMVTVGGSGGHYHAEEHQKRGRDVASELNTGCQHGRGS